MQMSASIIVPVLPTPALKSDKKNFLSSETELGVNTNFIFLLLNTCNALFLDYSLIRNSETSLKMEPKIQHTVLHRGLTN